MPTIWREYLLKICALSYFTFIGVIIFAKPLRQGGVAGKAFSSLFFSLGIYFTSSLFIYLRVSSKIVNCCLGITIIYKGVTYVGRGAGGLECPLQKTYCTKTMAVC